MFAMISARLRKREGFTLIELLVVVAIIGLLATLAMPRVFESINKAKRAQGDADVHTMSTAIEQLFMESTNSAYPTGPFADATQQGATTTDIKNKIVGSGLLKAHAKNLTNPFNHGYIYITSDTGDWYAVIDPASTPNDTASTVSQAELTCNGKTIAVNVGASFTVHVDLADTITLADVRDFGCTAENSSAMKLSVITN